MAFAALILLVTVLGGSASAAPPTKNAKAVSAFRLYLKKIGPELVKADVGSKRVMKAAAAYHPE